MKKVSGIFLLFVFLYNQVGFFIAFNISRERNYVSVRENKSTEHLSVISVAKKDASAIHYVHDDEFIYKGRRYDVFKKVMTDAAVLFYCFADENDDTLFKNLDDNIAQQVAGEKPLQKNDSKNNLQQFVSKEYLQPQNNFLFQKELSKMFAQQSPEGFKSRNPEKESPPPKMLFG